ncbi:MAG: hypothetical protein IPO04_13980 [Cytophagaceae bacterium]|nr:hypothetical protein [Cytophagaceae bacterium]MBL0300930.1 hypothetical protein [Cytophagaceae bacterium]
MKKVILSILFILVSVFAWSNDEFSYSENDLNFDNLNKLESYINSHPGTTMEVLKSEKSELLSGIAIEESTISTINLEGDMPIVGSFWWGCCLGVVGLLLVYFITDNDKDQVKSAVWGCLIATVLWGMGGLWNPFGWF